MRTRRTFLLNAAGGLAPLAGLGQPPGAGGLDPRGKVHIPIGIPNTVDTLKTFVEAEGCFSPGVGSFGVYFWIFDRGSGKLVAPGLDGVAASRGLAETGLLIPWIRWKAGGIEALVEICQTQLDARDKDAHVAAARIRIANRGPREARLYLYAALRPLGPAGFPVHRLEAGPGGYALLAGGRTALVAESRPESIGASSEDNIAELALTGRMPPGRRAESASGDCSGALRFQLRLAPSAEAGFAFVCPVLAGRRAVGHKWVDLKQNAMVDAAELNPAEGGILQPDLGVTRYRALGAGRLFRQAAEYWGKFAGAMALALPDPRWKESMTAIIGHAALSMNEGAPDVAVVNYNVFNRDGVYVANIMQKAGLFDLAAKALDYFLEHPFNGRAYPEADNPGQVLWSLGQQWLFARDSRWLRRIYPAAAKLAAMVAYYRTAPGPHWVNMASLRFGDELSAGERQELRPGRCDGYHPEYTEAFDIAGLRAAADLADAAGNAGDASRWNALAANLLEAYDRRFGAQLSRNYGSYAVLWPCRLYPLSEGKGFEQFRGIGMQKPGGWRYFPLATAHQGLLAGNREAGYATLAAHLDHEQMRGWYAFDEGGGSGSGGWHRLRTNWTRSVAKPGENLSVAMPHGWAIAEFWLLMRDCLVYEDGRRLVLTAGVPPEWFRSPEGMQAAGLPTTFGACGFRYALAPGGAVLELSGTAAPPEGYALMLPPSLRASVVAGGRRIEASRDGAFVLPRGAAPVRLQFP